MDKNQIGLDSLNNAGLTEVPWGASQAGQQLTEVPFYQPTTPKPAAPAAPATSPTKNPFYGEAISNDRLDAIAKQEGLTPAQARIWKEGILAQESGKGANSKTSVDGARGAGQVIPDTFMRFAKPGEKIDNEDHNLAVSARIVRSLGNKFGDDPARIAVGYFSGEGNVNPGEGNPYKADWKDGNGKTVSGYASDVVRRLTGVSQAQAATTDTTKIPKWADITAKPEYAQLSPEDRQAAKELYFDHYIAPIAGSDAAALRAEFLAKQDAAGKTDAIKNPFNGTTQTNKGPSTAPSAEVNGLGNAAGQMLDAEAGIAAPPPGAKKSDSVMAGNERGKPSSAFSPVLPEVRKAMEASWDKADAKQRAQLEALPGWRGDIYRARAEGFKRQDAGGRDPLQNAQTRAALEAGYQAASPEEKQRLEALPGWQGDVFRQMRDGVFALTKNLPPDARRSLPTADRLDPRAEIQRGLDQDQLQRDREQLASERTISFSDFLADLAASFDNTPGAAKSAGAALYEGGDLRAVGSGTWTDRIITEARKTAKENALKEGEGGEATYFDFMGLRLTRQQLRDFPQSFAFSVATMGASILASIPANAIAAATTGPFGGQVAGYAASATAGGGAAYRMDTNGFMRDFRDALDKTSMQQRGKPLSNVEFVAIAESPEMRAAAKRYGLAIRGKGSFQDLLFDHGMHEAAWEAVGNAVTMGAGKYIFREAARSGLLKKVAAALGSTAVEMGGEMTTQTGQQRAESAAGITNEKPRSWTSFADWEKSFKEISGPTLLTQGATNTAAYAAGRLYNTPARQIANAINDQVDRTSWNRDAIDDAVRYGMDPQYRDKRTITPNESRRKDTDVGPSHTPFAAPGGSAPPPRREDPVVTPDGRIEPVVGDSTTPVESSRTEPVVGDLNTPVESGRTEPVVDLTTPPAGSPTDGRVEPTLDTPTDQAPPAAAPTQIGGMDPTQFATTRMQELIDKRDGTQEAPAQPLTPTESEELRVLQSGDQNAFNRFYQQNPPTQTAQPVVPEDPAIDDLAEVRLDQLRAKRDGTTRMVMTENGPQETEVPPTALTPAERKELDILESGNRSAIQAFYFGNKPQEAKNEGVQAQPEIGGPALGTDGQPGGTAAVQEPAAQAAGAQGSAEGGQRQQAVAEDEEARLEREAIAAEGEMQIQQPDDSDIPFDTTPNNGTQTPEAQQTEAQGSQQGAGEVAPPKNEKEAKARKAAKEPRRMNNEGRAEDGGPIMPGDVFLTSSGRTTTPYPSQKSERFLSQWLIDNAIEEAKARGDDYNATVFGAEKPAAKNGTLPPASIDSMQEYLFGQQPNVVPSILKPLSSDKTVGEVVDTSTQPTDQNPSESKSVQDFIEGKRDTPPTIEEVKAEKPATETEARKAKAQADLDAALGDLGDIFGKGSRLNVTPEQEQKILPVLTRVMDAAFRLGYYKFKDAARFVVKTIREKLGDDVADQITLDHLQGAYIGMAGRYQDQGASSKKDVVSVESLDELGEEATDKTEPTKITALDLYTPEGKMKVAQELADFFIGGGEFKTIVEARKKISEMIGKPIEAATELAKQADETIEVAIVLAGREIVQAGRKQGRSKEFIYDRLVDLYKRQPNLAVRSSTSVRDQAYSTPVPLAYLASELAGITYESKVLEPTAGNGMLLVGAAAKNATANELNGKRADMLDAMGFEAERKNAATESLAPAKSQDAVIANPPFGATKDSNGETIIYEVKPDYGTREVDHAIAFKALEAMKDGGRAVLIVGGSNATTDDGRQEDYRGKSKRSFYFNLYKDYNVVDHFTVDGSMYSKQGASYPVDVIVIEGRGKASRDLPAADLPQVIGSYEELKGKLNGTRSVESTGVSGADGATGGESAGGADNGAPVVGSTGRPGDGNGDQSGAGGDGAGVSGAGNAGNGRTEGSGGVSGAAQPEPAYTPRLRNNRQGSVPSDGKGATGRDGGDRGNGSGNVDGTGRVNDQRVKSGLTDRRGEETETETQVSYAPRSAAASVGTLVPRAMRDAIQSSLQKVEDQFGNIDEYVAERLNYDPETLRANFSAEQVDALALAIKNAEEGRGFIIGDQTGIGKGRVVAAMIRYALVNDKIPIFVTEKPNLYADMIRDLDDIGMAEELGLESGKPKILITNKDGNIPYVLVRKEGDQSVEKNYTLKPPVSKDALDRYMNEMMSANSIGDFKVIFTTYNQLQKQNKKVPVRVEFIRQFAEGNYIIFDESHNAGGSGETQSRGKKDEGEATATGRAAEARALVGKANGTFFSSATYAKRPDVMSLYSSTNMKLAVDRISQLSTAIKLGGVPMQQVVANMLTSDGQYIRRERTFAGVSYDTVETKVDKQTAENMASAMRSILEFSRAKERVIKAMQKEMDKEGALVKQMGGETSTIQGVNFGSSMHNLIGQMLLSLKAQESVNHAIERLKANERVILTVSNTMGSFLKDYAEDMDLNVGDPMALSFKELYDKYLEKQRFVTIKDGAGKTTKRRLTDAELGPELVAQFNAVRKQIAESGFGAAPISPIDYMHDQLRKAGYNTDEITGRKVVINYQSGTPILASRSSEIKDRIKAINGFNDGTIDVLILNQSGSTGISLHASSKFKDYRKRHMIIVQAEGNIDTHMQMLGRVHRTGQVVPPAYSQMSADIPAEMRPAAVLAKKMASLSANTTASRKSAVSAEGVVDFMNDYGGQIVQEYLRDNPDVLEAVGGSKVVTLIEDPSEATEDNIRKFTGYIPVLPLAQQEQIYKDLVERYNELIERENTLGTNKLEAKAIDLDAKTISSQQITEDKGDPSIFASPANMEQVDVKRNVKPYTSAEVVEMVNERLGDKTAGAVANEMAKDVSDRTEAFEKNKIAELIKNETEPVKIESVRAQINLTLSHVKAVLQNYKIGDSIQIKDKNGFIVYGVITDIQNKGRTQNPAAGSAWKMQIALANGDAKSLTINFGQIGSRYELSRETRVNWYNSETQTAEMMSIIDIFDKGSTARRDKRWMVTGNILAGFAKYPGQIIQYTKADGTTGQGVLMPRQFDFNEEKKNAQVTLKSGDQVMQFIREAGERAIVGTPDGIFKMSYYNGRFTFSVPSSKREGGSYFLDNGLTGAIGSDFYKRGQQMQASTTSADEAKDAIDYVIKDREDTIIALTNVDVARQLFAPKPKEGGVTLNDIPSNLASDSIFSAMSEPQRVSALQRLKSLERKAEAGKITDAEYRLGVAQLIAQLQQKSDARSERSGDRVRGPDWVKELLLRARRTGELDGEMVDFALWLLDKNPELANDLAISIREGNNNTPAGSYRSISRLMSLFKNSTNTGTGVHEILHHAERMMPSEIQQGVTREWQRAWDAAYRKGDEKTRKALIELLKHGFGNKSASKAVIQAFRDGTLKYDDHYQLTNPSEYWAVNATSILAKRYGATTWQEKARNFLRDMIQYIKGALGFRSDAPILKALRAVINGDGQFISQKMLVERYMDQKPAVKANTVQPTEFMDIRDSVQGKLFKDRAKLTTFNWYDKSISTQLNKALKDADYAKVFGYVNAIQNEISLTALRPAEMAPGYLPRITDVKAAAKTLLVGRKAGTQQAKASQAIFAGTLAGDTVMEGKVWTPDELRNNFGLDDVGVALYEQARAAIDASLDEVAAAESYAMAQGFIPKAMRRAIIDNPQGAEAIISASLDQQIKKLQRAATVARDAGNEDQAKSMEETLNGYFTTAKQVEKIFTTARNLKAAGYAPLMRFGKYTVTVQLIDPVTGNLVRDDEGNPAPAVFFGKFETESEASAVLEAQQMKYAGQDDIKISAGTAKEFGYEMYQGISPETLALFAEALGADKVMRTYIQEALSERSALKRRLERKGVEGYTQDMPRVLANFITSNARHAAKQYYIRDLNNAIKYIPNEKGDVHTEAVKLREFALNAKDSGSVASSISFFWFLGGSVSSAAVNMTQPIMMTLPYLSQYGPAVASTAMAKALPVALGKKQMDADLKAAMKRASQEGVVDAQEIFHLYSQGAQSAATWLSSALSRIPGAGAKVKAGGESVRARMSAFGVLWGSMFAAAEGFNRRLTFAAAWEVAKQRKERDPYAFAVRAVNQTQGIFNKANRPNLARSGLGRIAFTFKQYSIMYLELIYRMVRHGGPEGRRAALMMLVILLLLSGEEGLPASQDLANFIDTIGQFMGYDTNMLRKKRELAYDILGKEFGDFALYGVSSFMPLDFQGRLGLGNMIPFIDTVGKRSNTPMDTVRSFTELIGPTASIGQQFGNAAEALSDENYGQAARNMAPTAVKNFMLGLDMLKKDHAVDAAGNFKVKTTPTDSYLKMIGFNPTVVAEKNRSQMPFRQDEQLQKKTESSIVKQFARAGLEKDQALYDKAKSRLDKWNKENPETPIFIKPRQVKQAGDNMAGDSDQRLIKKAPKEMRGRAADELLNPQESDE